MIRVSAVLALVTLLSAHPAVADRKQSCVAAYEDGQRQRRDGHPLVARQRFATCADEACPDLVRADCVRWLREIDDVIPSIVVRAHDGSGNDLVDVRVVMDGAVLAEHLDGKPIVVEPGSHQLRFEHAGSPAVVQTVVIAQGEHSRVLAITIPGDHIDAAPSPGPTLPTPGAAQPPSPDDDTRRGVPTSVYVFGGIGIAAVGGFGALEVKANLDLNHLQNDCAPQCNLTDVNRTRTQMRIADVGVAVGLVSLGVAVWRLVASHGPPRPNRHQDRRTSLHPSSPEPMASPDEIRRRMEDVRALVRSGTLVPLLRIR